MGKMLLAVSRVRKNSTLHEIPAKGNEGPAFASSETSSLHCLTCHLFLEREGWRPDDAPSRDAFAVVPFVWVNC